MALFLALWFSSVLLKTATASIMLSYDNWSFSFLKMFISNPCACREKAWKCEASAAPETQKANNNNNKRTPQHLLLLLVFKSRDGEEESSLITFEHLGLAKLWSSHQETEAYHQTLCTQSKQGSSSKRTTNHECIKRIHSSVSPPQQPSSASATELQLLPTADC